MLPHRITSLVAATHTPFSSSGELALDVVEKQAEHLLRSGVSTVFIGGTTGESHSLSLAERLALTQRWLEVRQGTAMKVVVHVGANALVDVCALAQQAGRLGADAISSLAPSYFKPKDVVTLVSCMAQVAAQAPRTPFFLYDIPSFTGMNLSMPDFLSLGAERIPTLAGIKFTNPDGMMFQQCLHHSERAFSILWGTDECLLAGLALGAEGAVGSTYNLAAPLYLRLITAFQAGDVATARAEQLRSVRIISRMASVGYMAAAKAVMGLLGVPVGQPRLPHAPLSAEQVHALHTDLEQMGFFSRDAVL